MSLTVFAWKHPTVFLVIQPPAHHPFPWQVDGRYPRLHRKCVQPQNNNNKKIILSLRGMHSKGEFL